MSERLPPSPLRYIWFILAALVLVVLAKNGLLAEEPIKPEPPAMLEVK